MHLLEDEYRAQLIARNIHKSTSYHLIYWEFDLDLCVAHVIIYDSAFALSS